MNNGSDKNREHVFGHADDEVDEYELYYGEDAPGESGNETKKLSGPLSRRPSPGSALLPFALSILFILCTGTLSNTPLADKLWASRERVFAAHEYWRLVTALFTHADAVHMLSNIPFFIFFGMLLYEYFGFLLFPAISLAIGVAANAITLNFYEGAVRLVGASGMIYGMAALWLVLYIYHDTDRSMKMRIFRAAGFTLIVLFPETYNPSTSYMAHAAGFTLGIISALLILPFAKVKNLTGNACPEDGDSEKS